MTRYQNLGGNSGVAAYEATEDSIQIVFSSGSYRNYLYNSARPGKVAVEKMKQLATAGRGLNSCISSVVKGNYAKRW